MKSFAAFIWAAVLLFGLTDALRAQMFSVSASAQPQQQRLITPTSAGAFLEFAEFSLFGSRPEGTTVPDYSFDGVLYGIFLRTPGLVLQLADRTSLGPH